jgi:hypothetical protein
MKSTKMVDVVKQHTLQFVVVGQMLLPFTMATQEHQIFATCNPMTLPFLTWARITTDMFLISLARYDPSVNEFFFVLSNSVQFPVSGKFTEDQALIFNAVLSAQRAVSAFARPGVSWVDCHRTAERAILTVLTEGGLLTGNVDEMIDAVLGPTFFPHGLGHLIGCDTHDVGG